MVRLDFSPLLPLDYPFIFIFQSKLVNWAENSFRVIFLASLFLIFIFYFFTKHLSSSRPTVISWKTGASFILPVPYSVVGVRGRPCVGVRAWACVRTCMRIEMEKMEGSIPISLLFQYMQDSVGYRLVFAYYPATN